jgi:hypothetical protein
MAAVGFSLAASLAMVPSAFGEGAWVLAEIGKDGGTMPLSAHTTLAECLEEQKSREAIQRAYLRAANESSPRDGLPLPTLTVSFRCLQRR